MRREKSRKDQESRFFPLISSQPLFDLGVQRACFSFVLTAHFCMCLSIGRSDRKEYRFQHLSRASGMEDSDGQADHRIP